jgi:hypothetical protein
MQGEPPDAVQWMPFVSFEELRDCHFVSCAEYLWLVVVTTPGYVECTNKVLAPSRVNLFQDG